MKGRADDCQTRGEDMRERRTYYELTHGEQWNIINMEGNALPEEEHAEQKRERDRLC